MPDRNSRAATIPDDGRHGLLSEGFTVGLVGALAVALWFLVVDGLAGRPLYTPALLGAMVSGTSDAAVAAEGADRLRLAALYTPLHLAAFALVGVIAVALVHRAARTPAMLALLFMLFVALEVGFTGLVAILEQGALGALAWYQIAAGNLVAIAAMGTILWRRHRGVAHAWRAQFADDG